MNEYLTVLKKYAVFSGRATRKEFWLFFLITTIISIILTVIDMVFGLYDRQLSVGVLSGLYLLAVFLPTLAVQVRRLHDTGRSGWWIWITLIPLIGFIILIVFLAQASIPGDNKYGTNPN